jgi:opacity protein-like surface antigen
MPIKKYSVALVALLAVLPVTAHAQTYVGVSGGLVLADDSKNSGEFTSNVAANTSFPAIASGTKLAWTTEYEEGYNISAQIGHRFEGGLRVEADFGYARSGIDKHRGMTVGGTDIGGRTVNILTRQVPTSPTGFPTVAEALDSGIGKQENLSLFGNVLYDLNAGGSFMPYVGVGAGLMRTKLDFRPSNLDVGQSSDTNFAWQAMAGATYKVNDSFELFGQYSYRDGGTAKMKLDLLPATIESKVRQSVVSAGVRFRFGG